MHRDVRWAERVKTKRKLTSRFSRGSHRGRGVWALRALAPLLQSALGDLQFQSRLALREIILLPPVIEPLTQALGLGRTPAA